MLFSKADYRSRFGHLRFLDTDGGAAGGNAGAAPGASAGAGAAAGAAAGAQAGAAAGAGAAAAGAGGAGADDGKVTFTDAQQAFINGLVADAVTRGENKAKTAAQAETDRLAAAKAIEDAAAKGDFETAKAALESDKTKLTTRAETAEGVVTRYETALKPQVETLEGEIAPELRPEYKADAPLIDRFEFLVARKATLAAWQVAQNKGGAGTGAGAGAGTGNGAGAGAGAGNGAAAGMVATPAGAEGDGFDEAAAKQSTAHQWNNF